MSRKLVLLVLALATIGIMPAHAGVPGVVQASPVIKILSVDGQPAFRVSYIPGPGQTESQLPDIFAQRNALGQACVGIAEATMLSVCQAGSEVAPEPSAPLPQNHLPNPPFGLCFSQHIFVNRPRVWLFICACVPDMHPAEPLSGPYLFQDIEGNPASCFGMRTGFNGFVWVCVLAPSI